jgi:hypothetical protein
MTARATSAVMNLVKDSGTAAVVSGTGVAAGNVIVGLGTASSALGLVDHRKYVIVINSGTAGTVTVRGTGSGVDANGAAQTSPYPSNAVFTQGSEGDITFAYATGTPAAVIGPFTSDRILQPDGNVYLDWNQTGNNATFYVLQVPFNLV